MFIAPFFLHLKMQLQSNCFIVQYAGIWRPRNWYHEINTIVQWSFTIADLQESESSGFYVKSSTYFKFATMCDKDFINVCSTISKEKIIECINTVAIHCMVLLSRMCISNITRTPGIILKFRMLAHLCTVSVAMLIMLVLHLFRNTVI